MLTKDEIKLMKEFNVKTLRELENRLDEQEERRTEENEYYSSFNY